MRKWFVKRQQISRCTSLITNIRLNSDRVHSKALQISDRCFRFFLLQVMAILVPFEPCRSAMALPIPLETSVTNATFPLRDDIA